MLCIDIDENKKAIYIDRIKQYIHKLDIKKYDVYKLNPKIFGKFGGADYKVSHLDIILSSAQEESYLEEELINLEIEETKWHNLCVEMEEGNCLEYEDYDDEVVSENNTDYSIEPDDVKEYDRVKSIYYMNIDLEYIVKDELKNFSDPVNNHREHKNAIIKLVRANSKYKNLNNKKQLSSCVTRVLNKTDIVYTFDLTQRVYEIFLKSCERNFEEVRDLLLDLDKDIDKLNDISFNKGLDYVEYIVKLEKVKYVLEKMIECENFREYPDLKYYLLNGLKIEIEDSNNYIKTTSRKYKSEVRTSSKESIRSKALELKSEGIRNNEIARRLGKSKGYISELLNGKK